MKRLKATWKRLGIYFDVFMHLARYMQQPRLYGDEFMIEEYHKTTRRNTMFSRKIKSFVKRLLYGREWEQIEQEVYMPIVGNKVDDGQESQCINVYGKPKGINCGETFGELCKEIKALKQISQNLDARLEDLEQTSELTSIQLVNLLLEIRTQKMTEAANRRCKEEAKA
jgi:hypothetical protein